MCASRACLTAVAQAHTRALELEEAAGNRFIVGAGKYATQDFLDVSIARALSAGGSCRGIVTKPNSSQFLHVHYPDLPNVAVGRPGTHDELTKDTNLFVGDKAARVLGIKYESFEDTLSEMAKSLERFGWKA